MALLDRYDPPAFLPDFNEIPGQLEAWNAAMSNWFDAIVAIESDTIGAPSHYYNATQFDPGGVVVAQDVTWNAFPKELLRRYGRERALALADWPWPIERYRDPQADPLDRAGTSGILYRPQEEYCEWHVERDLATGRIVKVSFTSEPPETWQALFGLVPGGGGIPDALFPGDQDLLLDRYREWVDPNVQMEDLVAPADIIDADGTTWIGKGQYNFYNKWNTSHGLVHLCSPPNSLVAEIQLGGDATVLRSDPKGRLLVEPDALIAYAAYGGPNRNSDPTIGSTVNALARLGMYVTLRNPVGLYMDHIDLSGWAAPDGGNVSEFVRIVRGRPGMIERMVIEAPKGRKLQVADLTIAGEPLRYGGQIAECVTVKLTGIANIVSPPALRHPVAPAAHTAIDPNYPLTVGRGSAITHPTPPGSVEAYLNQGALPGTLSASRSALIATKAGPGKARPPQPGHRRGHR